MNFSQRARIATYFSVFFTSFTLSTMNADTLSTWNGGTGTWSTAAQWTPAAVPDNAPGNGFNVSIATVSDRVGLDVSPVIDSLAIGGTAGTSVLTTDYDHATGFYTSLTTTGNVTVNSHGVIGTDPFSGWLDSLVVGRNLTNAGNLLLRAQLSVAGNVTNSGSLYLIGGPNNGFSAGGTLRNTGSLYFGENQSDFPTGQTSVIGSLVNKGYVLITDGTTITLTAQPNGLRDVAQGTSWVIGGTFNAGSQSALANLTTVEGSLSLQNSYAISPKNGTLTNTGTFGIGGLYGPSTVTVTGKFSNSGNLVIGDQNRPYSAASTLAIQGTLINQSNGTLHVNTQSFQPTPSPGQVTAQQLVNYGTATVDAGSLSSARELDNYGTFTDFGTLQVGTLKYAGGQIYVAGNLAVGSGAVSGQAGSYQQFSDGVLEFGGITIDAATASLDGTLDIMLGNGAKPVGTVFDILLGTPFTGAFSNVEGSIFDNGRQKYVLDYDHADSIVSLTVANNTTPEPGSAFLSTLGIATIAGLVWLKQNK